jgi:hypothetical protein
MANYIDKEILAEAYTHLAIELFDDKVALEKLRRELLTFFQERASFIFENDVQIAIEFEEGSLKTRVIAYGSAAAIILGAVSQYGSFRDSVTQLANDAVGLAHAANIEVVFRTKTRYCDRLRVEKRKGVFGRVATYLNDLDGIASDIEVSKLPTSQKKVEEVEELVNRLVRWDQQVDRLFEKLEEGETQACIANGLRDEVLRLPRSLPWKDELTSSSLRAQVAASDTAVSVAASGVLERYEAGIRAIDKKLKARVEQNG